MRYFLLILLFGFFMTGPAYAACTSPSGVGGSVNYDDTTKTTTICDGTTWKVLKEVDYSTTGARQRIQISNDSGSCTPDKLGRLRYDGIATWEFCNGVNWLPF